MKKNFIDKILENKELRERAKHLSSKNKIVEKKNEDTKSVSSSSSSKKITMEDIYGSSKKASEMVNEILGKGTDRPLDFLADHFVNKETDKIIEFFSGLGKGKKNEVGHFLRTHISDKYGEGQARLFWTWFNEAYPELNPSSHFSVSSRSDIREQKYLISLHGNPIGKVIFETKESPEDVRLSLIEDGYNEEIVVINESDPSLKPPKKWFKKMFAKMMKKYKNEKKARAIVGAIWYKKMGKSSKVSTRRAEGKKYGPAPKNEGTLPTETPKNLVQIYGLDGKVERQFTVSADKRGEDISYEISGKLKAGEKMIVRPFAKALPGRDNITEARSYRAQQIRGRLLRKRAATSRMWAKAFRGRKSSEDPAAGKEIPGVTGNEVPRKIKRDKPIKDAYGRETGEM